jgi:hypothetical protein
VPEEFQCPACGAPMDIPEDAGATMRCPYCNASVVVPEELRENMESVTSIKIDLSELSSDHPMQISLGSDDPILTQLRAGNKIEAIKLYRLRTGLGLKESKDAVEAIQAGMTVSVESPQGLQPVKQTSARVGCILGVVILVVILALFGVITAAALTATTRAVSDSVLVVQEVIATVSPTPGLAELVMTVGEKGSGAGKMTDARSVSQDKEGTIYVADYLPGRVQVFNAEGDFISQWTLADPDQPLTGIAALPGERVAVVTNRSIGIYEGRSGKALAEWRDGEKSGYSDAWRMADGTLAVTRTSASDNDVLIFDVDGNIIQRIEQAFTSQTGESEMEMSVASDLAGNLYLLGSFNRLVLKYDRSGKFITRMGGEGDQPGYFTFPNDIAVDSSGQVFVSEGLDVIIFDSNGRYTGEFQAEGVASGMYTNPKDELLISARDQVLVYRMAR